MRKCRQNQSRLADIEFICNEVIIPSFPLGLMWGCFCHSPCIFFLSSIQFVLLTVFRAYDSLKTPSYLYCFVLLSICGIITPFYTHPFFDRYSVIHGKSVTHHAIFYRPLLRNSETQARKLKEYYTYINIHMH